MGWGGVGVGEQTERDSLDGHAWRKETKAEAADWEREADRENRKYSWAKAEGDGGWREPAEGSCRPASAHCQVGASPILPGTHPHPCVSTAATQAAASVSRMG